MMMYLRFILLMIVLGLGSASAAEAATTDVAGNCPEAFEAEGDWDQDGILNVEDACCFTATLLEHNDPAYCPDDGSADNNLNHQGAEEEGECCVTLDGTCARADSPVCSPNEDNVVFVPCDQLLYYSGMNAPFPVDSCGDACICYTVDDFDDDFDRTGAQGPRSGAEDNCPTTANPTDANTPQANGDGDIFGDACDLCKAQEDEPIVCEMGIMNDTCPIDSTCVPFVFFGNRQSIVVEHYCSAPDLTDADGDGVGHLCDNCPAVKNPEQTDSNMNNVGDACDPEIVTDTDTNTDTNTEVDTHDSEIHDTADSDTTERDASVEDTGEDTEVDAGKDTNEDKDTGVDTGVDTGEDTGKDTGIDTGKDTEIDTGKDTGIDTGEDTGNDSEIDTGKDTEIDTGKDTGTDTEIDAGEDTGIDTDKDTTEDSSSEVKDTGEDTAGIDTGPDTGDSETAEIEDLYLGGAYSCDCGVAPGKSPASPLGPFLLSLFAFLMLYRKNQ